MVCLRLMFCIFVVVYTVHRTEAGLLDILGQPQYTNNRPNLVNSLLSPLIGNGRNGLHHIEETEPTNTQPWLNFGATPSPTRIKNIFPDLTTTTTSKPGYDAVTAQRLADGLADGKALLETLKELNKLKEAKNLKEANNLKEKNDLKVTDNVNGAALLETLKELNKLKEANNLKETNKLKDPKETHDSKDTGVSEDLDTDKHANSGDDNTMKIVKEKDHNKDSDKEDSSTADEPKALTKKQFFYQVQPVRPEGEKNNIKETVYYVDS